MALFGCLWLENLPFWAAVEADASLRSQAVVVHHNAEVVAVSPAAGRSGINRGWSLARAQAHAALQTPLQTLLLLVPLDEALCAWTWQQVMRELHQWSPRMESPREALCFFEMPSSREEQRALARFVFGRWARCGVAADRVTAHMVAYSAVARQMGIVRPGQEAEFAEGVPLEQLVEAGVSARTIERLDALGLRWIGQLRALGRLQRQVIEDEELWRFVRADATQRLLPLYHLPPSLTSRFDFATPSTQPARWEAALDTLLADAASRLRGQSTLAVSIGVRVRGGRRVGSRLLSEPAWQARALRKPARALLVCLLSGEASAPVSVESLDVRLGNLQPLAAPVAPKTSPESEPGVDKRVVLPHIQSERWQAKFCALEARCAA